MNGAKLGRYTIDIVKVVDTTRIAIEYDCWYWHRFFGNRDAAKDKALIAAGWRVLRVRSNKMLPDEQSLAAAFARIVSGEPWVDIVLSDWGA
ncbi:MAG TPA: DUF559 domain-containing protein [Pirellulales bacterium]